MSPGARGGGRGSDALGRRDSQRAMGEWLEKGGQVECPVWGPCAHTVKSGHPIPPQVSDGAFPTNRPLFCAEGTKCRRWPPCGWDVGSGRVLSSYSETLTQDEAGPKQLGLPREALGLLGSRAAVAYWSVCHRAQGAGSKKKQQ